MPQHVRLWLLADIPAYVDLCLLSGVKRTSRHLVSAQHHFSRNSLHLGAGELPQGMIGTVEVEFCGDPSMILSL